MLEYHWKEEKRKVGFRCNFAEKRLELQNKQEAVPKWDSFLLILGNILR